MGYTEGAFGGGDGEEGWNNGRKYEVEVRENVIEGEIQKGGRGRITWWDSPETKFLLLYVDGSGLMYEHVAD